jgi:hypothetical protein
MTENQELQAFDETLREFLKEPDHFLTSLALVNHLLPSWLPKTSTQLKWKERRLFLSSLMNRTYNLSKLLKRVLESKLG